MTACRVTGIVTLFLIGTVPAGAPAAVDDGSPPAGQATLQPARGTPQIELEPTTFDFGEVWERTPVKSTFTVRNVGTAPLTLKVHASCGCTTVTKPKSVLAPGETDTFTITYSTRHTGKARKRVTLITNDPQHPRVNIEVRGEVKPLFKGTIAGKKADRILFRGVTSETRKSETLRLENNFGRPVHLALKEGQDFDGFDIQLREVEPGQVYELIATTRPPLEPGAHRAAVKLETGIDVVPEIEILVATLVERLVSVTPPQLYVRPDAPTPNQQMLRIQYRPTHLLEITRIESTLESISVEVLPSSPPEKGQPVAFRQIRVTLPPYDEVPLGGATLTIFTNHPDPQYQRIEIPVIKRVLPGGRPSRNQPG